MGTTLLAAKRLCKSFAGDGIQNHVLSNIDLELYEGDFTVIMGASGSGKSTLLYCLSGMDRPTSGEIIYGEKNIAKEKEQALARLRAGDFGFVFQQMRLVSNLSLFENVAVPGYLNKAKTTAEIREKSASLLGRMGLDSSQNRLPAQASGGEQQRCAIARAVINSPKLLFADEPTGALNRKSSTEVLDLLTEINADGQSILMVTHDVRAAARANRLLYIEDGKIIGEIKLAAYEKEDEKSRETQINAWLSSLKW